MNLEPTAQPRASKLPIGPGREAFSRRTRTLIAIVLAAVVALAVLLGILAATHKSAAPLRTVTIPAADRSASRSLLLAAEEIGFQPRTEAGVGQIESQPIAAGSSASAKSLLPPGTPAPSFSLRTPVGVPVSLASLRGKAVLLEFFATWCPHCAAEAPHLKTLYASLPHSKYAFLAVNADGETAPSVLAYHIYFDFPFPAVLDPSSNPGSFTDPGSPGAASSSYKVGLFPTFYVVDPAGKVAWAGTGEQPDALLLGELHTAAAAG
ncbi:MAG TPA: TlpA disulfide reductase family protein [Gaiellaceae bacterium]|jgi:thiol-disulfide isomerase/thioredoxin